MLQIFEIETTHRKGHCSLRLLTYSKSTVQRNMFENELSPKVWHRKAAESRLVRTMRAAFKSVTSLNASLQVKK